MGQTRLHAHGTMEGHPTRKRKPEEIPESVQYRFADSGEPTQNSVKVVPEAVARPDLLDVDI